MIRSLLHILPPSRASSARAKDVEQSVTASYLSQALGTLESARVHLKVP
jgi:hypothetical protein